MRLRELVAIKELGLEPRACVKGLNRGIRWVHTTELLDASRYLQGGELILTTGVWRTRRGAEDDFVSALVRARVCGLVYGLPKPHARLPRALIDACESHGLPLLEASFDLPFIAISKAVIDNFADEHRVALASALHRSDQLVSAVLNGNVTEGVLSVLARKDGLHPWLLEPDGSVVGSPQSSLEADLIGLVIRATRGAETFRSKSSHLMADGERHLLSSMVAPTTGSSSWRRVRLS